jgi:hypothetical protein
MDPGLRGELAEEGDAATLAYEAEVAKDDRRLNCPGAPVYPIADGAMSTHIRDVAIDIAEHMARGRPAYLSMSLAELAAGVEQAEDIGEGVGSLRAIGAAGGCMTNRGSRTRGDALSGNGRTDCHLLSSTQAGLIGDRVRPRHSGILKTGATHGDTGAETISGVRVRTASRH